MTAMKNRRNHLPNSKNSTTSATVTHAPPFETLLQTARDAIRRNPEAAALWCFGIGFVLGWKLKLW